jgi:hypothetical protein
MGKTQSKMINITLKDNKGHFSGFTKSNGFSLTYTLPVNSTVKDLLILVNEYREQPITRLYTKEFHDIPHSFQLTDDIILYIK